MGLKTYQFKTTLNCGGCVSKVQDDLNNAAGVGQWEVDTDNPDKILTVNATDIYPDEIIAIITKKGFKATLLD